MNPFSSYVTPSERSSLDPETLLVSLKARVGFDLLFIAALLAILCVLYLFLQPRLTAMPPINLATTLAVWLFLSAFCGSVVTILLLAIADYHSDLQDRARELESIDRLHKAFDLFRGPNG